MTTLILIPTLNYAYLDPNRPSRRTTLIKKFCTRFEASTPQTTKQVAKRGSNLCLLNKLTLILTLKLKIATTLNLTLTTFTMHRPKKKMLKFPRVGFERRMYTL